ncbi:MAG: type II secretion system protein [Bacilli bacterium]
MGIPGEEAGDDMTRKVAKPARCRRLDCGQRGDTLIEVLAAMTILAIIIIPFSMLGVNVFQWLAADAHQGQAFTYAREGIQSVRQADWMTLPPKMNHNGIIYYRSICGPNTVPPSVPPKWIENNPSLNSNLKYWEVIVKWTEPDTGVTHSVSLETVVDPKISG